MQLIFSHRKVLFAFSNLNKDVISRTRDMQKKQSEWKKQWENLEDKEFFLFQDWIKPFQLDDFRGKNVLECGCGGGYHTSLLAQVANSVTAVDLNTADLAKERNSRFTNVRFFESDIAHMNLNQQFDFVVCVGVVHHTDDPELTVANLKRHVRPGGFLILWVYSREGNWLVENGVEPFREKYLGCLARRKIYFISQVISLLLYFPVYSLYCLPLRFLPFFEYFGNFRKLSFERNTLNVFDKLNAPQVQFISRGRAETWIQGWENASVIPYKGVSFSISGKKPLAGKASKG